MVETLEYHGPLVAPEVLKIIVSTKMKYIVKSPNIAFMKIQSEFHISNNANTLAM